MRIQLLLPSLHTQDVIEKRKPLYHARKALSKRSGLSLGITQKNTVQVPALSTVLMYPV